MISDSLTGGGLRLGYNDTMMLNDLQEESKFIKNLGNEGRGL